MLSFDLSEEQQMIRDTVGAFAREQIRPAARAADESGEIPAALVAQGLATRVWCSGPIPENFGGNGDTRSATTGAIVAEELAYRRSLDRAPRAGAASVRVSDARDGHRRTARSAISNASPVRPSPPRPPPLMEPRFDFDPQAMTTVARRDGNGFVLNGAKCMRAARRRVRHAPGYAAASARTTTGVDGFLLARDTPGLTFPSARKTWASRRSRLTTLELKDCRVGAEARLGGEGGTDFRG